MEERYYELLNLKPHATAREIKAAYRKLAIKYHPDKNKTADPNYFRKVTEAYNVLSDPEQKLAYDRKRQRVHAPRSTRPIRNTRPEAYARTRNRASARRYAYRPKQKIDYDAFVSYFKMLALFSFMTAILFFTDYFTTTLRYSETINHIELMAPIRRGGINEQIRVLTDNINVKTDIIHYNDLRDANIASLYTTYFFKINKKLIVEENGKSVEVILVNFFYMIIAGVIIIMSFMIYRNKTDSKFVIELGSATCFLMLIMFLFVFLNN